MTEDSTKYLAIQVGGCRWGAIRRSFDLEGGWAECLFGPVWWASGLYFGIEQGFS